MKNPIERGQANDARVSPFRPGPGAQDEESKPARMWARAVVTVFFFLVLSITGLPNASGTEELVSCETNLTCARQVKAALEHKRSRGPNLGEWRILSQSKAPTLLATAAQQAPPSVKDRVTGMELVLIPEACYRTDESHGRPKDVCLDAYYIGAYEVTFDEYERFAKATGRDLPDDEDWGRGRRPVINVNVYDALNFSKWLSRRTGFHYRLPTEVEWAHAARAGRATRYPWGDELGANRANCDGCGSKWDDERTAPVGSFAPNAWGLYDVVGNVGEWTCSMRDPDPTHSFERCDSIYQTRRRAYRNGGWSDAPGTVALSSRDWNAAMRRTDFVGFRLVRECNECKAGFPSSMREELVQQRVQTDGGAR